VTTVLVTPNTGAADPDQTTVGHVIVAFPLMTNTTVIARVEAGTVPALNEIVVAEELATVKHCATLRSSTPAAAGVIAKVYSSSETQAPFL
jgi:hypothetical protein